MCLWTSTSPALHQQSCRHLCWLVCNEQWCCFASFAVIPSNTCSDSQAACLHAGCLARYLTMYRSSSLCIKGCGTLTQMCHPVMGTHTITVLQPRPVAKTQPALRLPLRWVSLTYSMLCSAMCCGFKQVVAFEQHHYWHKLLPNWKIFWRTVFCCTHFLEYSNPSV